jgi:type I restriction enzyme S subunit
LVRFGDLLAEPLKNGVYRPKEFHGRGAKVINMKELFAYERIDDQATDRVYLTADELERFRVRSGDLLFARRSFVLEGSGKCSIIGKPTEDTTFESSMIRARLDTTRALPRFMYYLFASPIGRAAMAAISTQTAVSGITGKSLQKMLVPIPRLKIQNKISVVLSAYDDLIEKNDYRIKLLDEMAQRIDREWFVDFHYPGHEDVPLVESELGLIPTGWEVAALSTVCKRITDGAHASPATTSVGKPMASVKDMTPRRLALDKCRNISTEDYELLVRWDCQPLVNDVLVAKDGSYLKHVFVVRESEDVAILSSIALLRPNDSIQPDVLALCLQRPETKERLKGFVSGAAIPRIVIKDFRTFPIVRPPDALQRGLVEQVEPLLLMALKLDEVTMNLRASRNLLLRGLISGEVDVTDLDIAMPEVAA